MRRVVIHRAGGYEQLRIEAFGARPPRVGEVRVRTAAVGVNYADCIVRMGLYESAKEYVGWPITPGFELAGHVEAVGPGVTAVREGDPVFGVTRFDGYATHVTVPVSQVFALPNALTMTQAAGFPSVFLTAYFALFELCHPRAGQRIMVHAAAGGVGSAALQLAKILDLESVGVVGKSNKVETAQAMGARHVIDKSRVDLWAEAERIAPKGYHVILDANGVATLKESYEHLASPGKLVIYGFHSMMPREGGKPNYPKLAVDWLRTPRFDPFELTNKNRSVLAFNLSYLFEEAGVLEDAMRALLGWLSEGKLTAPPVRTYPLDEVADAHRALESGTTVGKLVLVP